MYSKLSAMKQISSLRSKRKFHSLRSSEEIIHIISLLRSDVIIWLNIHILIIGKKYINELLLKYFPYRVKWENLKIPFFSVLAKKQILLFAGAGTFFTQEMKFFSCLNDLLLNKTLLGSPVATISQLPTSPGVSDAEKNRDSLKRTTVVLLVLGGRQNGISFDYPLGFRQFI